jgi:UDP-2,3-diacylglucosamine pyrophosphatase LpxH
VGQSLAQHIVFALENQDIIQARHTVIPVPESKYLVIADLHIPFQDEEVLKTILEYADREQVDGIVINGDLLDFYKISRFRKNPLERSTREELKQARDFLTGLRMRYPTARIIYKEGNHDRRLENYIIDNVPELYDVLDCFLEKQLGLKGLNIHYIKDPFNLGKLTVLHGDETQYRGGNAVNVCETYWKYIYNHFIVAHCHRKDQRSYKNIYGEVFWTGSLGYCATDMEYARINKWTRGFSIVNFLSDGRFRARIFDVVDGEIYG